MIFWKGMGLLIPLVIGLSLYLCGLPLDEELKSGSLHYGSSLILSGCLVYLIIWKKGRNDEKYLNHEDLKLRENYRKNNISNPMSDIENATLFFIPFVYWKYILWAGGAVYLVLFYSK